MHLLVKNCCILKRTGEKFSTKFSVASRNTLLRFLALFVPTFGDVTPMVDNLREMFGRHDVAAPEIATTKFVEFLFHAIR